MERGISEKNLWRFVNILSLIFEEGDKQKNCTRFFKIYKCTVLIFEKRSKRKNFDRFFEICKYTFLILEKEDQWKKCVRVCKYTIFNIWKRL